MFKGTTIIAVRRNGQVAIGGDGQITFGENTVFKTTANKLRRLYSERLLPVLPGRWQTRLRCLSALRRSFLSTGKPCESQRRVG